MWLLGLDEDARQVVALHENFDLANWYPQIEAKFDDREAPRLIQDRWFEFETGPVLALEFDTGWGPYVVSSEMGGTFSLAVPWRQGTRVRSAKRLELQQMLVARTHTPALRWLELNVNWNREVAGEITGSGRVLFSIPSGSQPVFLPYDDMETELMVGDRRIDLDLDWGEVADSTISSSRMASVWFARSKEPEAASATRSGIAVEWVGSVPFGIHRTDALVDDLAEELVEADVVQLHLTCRVLSSDLEVSTSGTAVRSEAEKPHWILRRD